VKLKEVVLAKHGSLRVKFCERAAMRKGHPARSLKASGLKSLPPVALPIDWTKGDTLPMPMDGNDTYGICMEAAADHADRTMTGNVGVESSIPEADLLKQYLALSGGDNGLDEGTLVKGWEAGLGGNTQASILDALDIDPNDAPLMQSAVDLFGGVLFMLSVCDPWYANFTTGYVWDAGPGITADPANGHGIWLNGVDASGKYKLQTWGAHGWITAAGVKVCDPSAFVVFSARWFDPVTGIAPNGYSYDQLATLWVSAGGKVLPPWAPPAPPPGPGPVPPPPVPGVTATANVDWPAGNFRFVATRSQRGSAMTLSGPVHAGTVLSSTGAHQERHEWRGRMETLHAVHAERVINWPALLALLDLLVQDGPLVTQVVDLVEAEDWAGLAALVSMAGAPAILAILTALGIAPAPVS
jgi:hypothetical protein